MKKNCLYCGKAFETVRQNQQTCCSNACKTKYKIDVSRKFQEYIKSADGSLDLKTDPPKKKPKESKAESDDPKWIKDYCKADRLTKISMLSGALSDYGIAHLSYGNLTQQWDTLNYLRWEKQVFKLKRKEHEHEADNLKNQNTIKSKDSTKSKKRSKKL